MNVGLIPTHIPVFLHPEKLEVDANLPFINFAALAITLTGEFFVLIPWCIWTLLSSAVCLYPLCFLMALNFLLPRKSALQISLFPVIYYLPRVSHIPFSPLKPPPLLLKSTVMSVLTLVSLLGLSNALIQLSYYYHY